MFGMYGNHRVGGVGQGYILQFCVDVNGWSLPHTTCILSNLSPERIFKPIILPSLQLRLCGPSPPPPPTSPFWVLSEKNVDLSTRAPDLTFILVNPEFEETLKGFPPFPP